MSFEPKYLMLPGPTEVPHDVRMAGARPMINHRGADFTDLLSTITKGLQEMFQTCQEVYTLTASGTGAMEAAIVNTLSPGDTVLSCSMGVFGDRFADIAKRYGAQVESLETPRGRAVDPAALATRLAQDKDHRISALLLTHNETSTAVENSLEALSKARGSHPALMLVDAVSSLGATDLRMDAWGLDAVATASQKALMTPPGLAFVALSERGWAAAERAAMPRYYFDLRLAKKFLAKGQTPFTPALPQCWSLAAALARIFQEGREPMIARHRRHAAATRAAVKALGLSLFADEAVASSTVTAVRLPAGLDGKALRAALAEQYGVVLAGGQGPLEKEIFRIGHLGAVSEGHILATIGALEMTLLSMGVDVTPGTGIAAAQKIYLLSPQPVRT